MMDVFDDNNLMDSIDWLKGLESTNLDDQLFNDILPKDDPLNFQPDLYTLDSLSSSMQFPFTGSDCNSESSDSGNYSPTSSSSDQQLNVWAPQDETYTQQQQQTFAPQSNAISEAYKPVVSSPEADTFEQLDYKPVSYAIEGYNEPPEVAHAPEVMPSDSRQFVCPPMVVKYSPQPPPPPPIYYVEEDYSRQDQQNIVYIVQDPDSTNAYTDQQQRCTVSPQRNIVMLPTPMKITHTVPKCVRVNPAAARYVNKRLLPPNTFFAHRPTPSTVASQEEEEKFMRKKEDRKLRNREAAQMSRQRKRNEFDQLKALLVDKEGECAALRGEVDELRRKVSRLEAENKELRGIVGICEPSGCADGQRRRTAAVKKAGGLFALVFVALMIFPSTIHTPSTITSMEISSINKSVAPYVGRYDPKVPHVGHALIALENLPDLSNSTEQTPPSKDLQLFRNGTNPFVRCPDSNTFYNSSQNVQLNAELTDWIERHEQMNFVQLRRGNFPSVIFNGRLTTDTILNTQRSFFKYFSDRSATKWADSDGGPAADSKKSGFVKKTLANKSDGLSSNSSDVGAGFIAFTNKTSLSARRKIAQQKIERERTLRHFDMMKRLQPDDNSSALPLKNAINNKRQTGKSEMLEFTSKIQQKGDTLYVVAMKDYFLLPALDIAKSAPKVSLILPALSANLSAPGQLTMMRIECNVVATSIFYLPDSVISLFNSSGSP